MLLTLTETALAPAAFVASAGEVFARFGAHSQDSGNVSYGVRAGAARFFVKTAGERGGEGAVAYADRIELLRNAVRLNRAISHPALPRLCNAIESPDGPILVYDWVEGELVGVPRAQRSDPASSFMRFRALPPPRVLAALDAVIDLHHRLASAGWIAVDFYDGSLVYDFERHRLHVVDLDHYHQGPFLNQMGRMYGSTRFMAPEEFERGATIDERTTVFTLGRAVFELLSNGSDHPDPFRGPPELREIARRAASPHPHHRFSSVAELASAWSAARASSVA
jgi:serine/threonine-protein kinase